MCCTKISGVDYFSKSRNCNLHLLVHRVFLKHRCEYEIKQSPSNRYIYWKTVAEVYPFERRHYSPSRPLATDRTASSRRFGVCKHHFRPKNYTSRTCITFGGKRPLQTPNLLELALVRQSLGVTAANNGVIRKGELQQRFFSKYTC